jgi:hypothetical protein
LDNGLYTTVARAKSNGAYYTTTRDDFVSYLSKNPGVNMIF